MRWQITVQYEEPNNYPTNHRTETVLDKGAAIRRTKQSVTAGYDYEDNGIIHVIPPARIKEVTSRKADA